MTGAHRKDYWILASIAWLGAVGWACGRRVPEAGPAVPRVIAPPQHGRRALDFKPYALRLGDGRTVEAELGYLEVPESRSVRTARPVQLAVIRLRGSTGASGNPILYLGGNPGGAPASATLRAPSLHPFFSALRATGDVLVLDYRGSGLSTPRLDCPSSSSPPRADAFASRDKLLATIRESAAACAAQLHASGTDLGGYTWSEIAEDISDLRAALGTTRLRLVGFSSGTHAALAFLRRHGPETERVVMIGTEGPDHTRKLPSNVDLQLQQIAALVRADTALQPEIPDFLALMRQVLEKLEREPAFVEVLVPGVEAKVRGSVGRFALALLTAKSLKGPEEFGRLPLLYYSIARGDLEILTRVVQRRVGGPPTNALNYILDGASGVSAEREQRIVGEAQESLLGDAVNFPFPEIQSVWGYQDLGASFRQPVHSPVPALFATGTLDGNTPPHQAEEIRRGFQHSGRLLILNGGHDSPFTATAAWDPIVSFLRAESMPDTTIELPAPAFAPLRR